MTALGKTAYIEKKREVKHKILKIFVTMKVRSSFEVWLKFIRGMLKPLNLIREMEPLS